jgi:hypothetical protein
MEKKTELRAAHRLVIGMTYARGDAESKITDLGYEFAQHVMKVYVFPHSSYLKGWLRELRAWYLRIGFIGSKLKGGKKFKASNYSAFLLEPILYQLDKFGNRVSFLIEDNPEIKPREDLNSEKMLRELQEFYTELGFLLEKGEDWSVVQTLLMKCVQE